MRHHRLTSILRRILGSTRTDMANGKALEADLLSRYRELYPKNRRWLVLLNPWNRAARFGIAGLAACLLLVGACTFEVNVEVDVGKQVVMNLPTDAEDEHRFIHTFIYRYRINVENADQVQEEISELLTTEPGVEDVSVSVSIEEEEEGEEEVDHDVSVDVLIFGPDLDGEGLVTVLKDSFPFLSDAAVTINDLRTTFSESLASWIGRTLFRLRGERPDAQELRLQVMEELGARE